VSGAEDQGMSSRPGQSPPERGTPRRRRGRRALRLAACLIGGVVGFLGLGLGIGLGLRPVRERALRFALERADRALPGSWSVTRAAWPRLGELRCDALLWTDGADTLAAAADLHLRIDTGALLHRDLRIQDFELRGIELDLPGVGRRIRPGEAEKAPRSKSGGGVPFLRRGTWPGVPSLSVENVRLEARRLQLRPDVRLEDCIVDGAFEGTHGRQGRLHVRRLELHERRTDVHVDSLAATLDLGTGLLQARGAGRFADVARVELTGSSTTSGDFELQIEDMGAGASTPRETPGAGATAGAGTGASAGAGVHAGAGRASIVAPESTGVHLAGRFERDRDGVREITLHGRVMAPGVRRLRQIPPLAPRLERLPDLAGFGIDLDGRIGLRPEFTADATLRLQPNDWLRAGGLRAHVERGVTQLDSVEVGLRGLRLAGSGRFGPGARAAKVRLVADGTEWLRPFTRALPDSLALRLEAQLLPEHDRSRLEARLRLGLRRGSLRIDDLRLAVESSDLAARAARFDLRVRQRAVAAEVRGAIAAAQRIEAELAPVDLVWPAHSLAEPQVPAHRDLLPTHAAYEPKTGSVEVHDLRITTPAGNVQARADAARDHGTAHLRVSWDGPPDALLERVASAGRDSVLRRWPPTAGVEVDATWQPDSAGTRARADGTLHLPGPRTFAALLPADKKVDDLADILGKLEFTLLLPRVAARHRDAPGSSPSWSAGLDLGATAWIDTGVVAVRGEGGAVRIDRLALAFEGLDLDANGLAGRDSLAFEARLALADPRLLRRWVHLDPKAQFTASVQATVRGRPATPDADARAEVRFVSPAWRVPRLEATARLAHGLIDRLDAAGTGAAFGELAFDRMRVEYRLLERSSELPAHVRIDVEGKEAALLGSFAIAHTDSGFAVGADTLQMRILDRDLRSRSAFRLESSAQGLRLSDLDLAGSLGTLRADALRSADSLRVAVDGRLVMPAQPEWIKFPPGLWPAHLEIVAHTSADSVRARLVAGGLHIGPRDSLDLGCDVLLDPGRAVGHVTLADGDQKLVQAEGAAGAAWSLEPPHFALNGDLRAHVQIDSLPLPMQGDVGYLDRNGLERCPVLRAEIDADGSAAAPAARLSGVVLYPHGGDLSRYTVDVEGQLVPRSAASGSAAPGMHATLRALRDNVAFLTGTMQLPVHVRLDSLRAGFDPDVPLVVQVTSENLALAELNPLLPTGTVVEGTANLRFAANGPVQDPALDGRLEASTVSVSRPDGFRLQLGGEATLGGTRRSPDLRGRFHIDSGILPVPDAPKDLLPPAGPALLWSGTSDTTAAGAAPVASRDTTGGAAHPDRNTAGSAVRSDTAGTVRSDSAAGAARADTAGAAAKPPGVAAPPAPRSRIPPGAKIDIGLKIPAGLRIRGKGLDVELGGDLQLVQQGAEPKVTGQLEARRGTFTIKGQRIPITRGKVNFFGPLDDPTLDLVLEKRFDSDNVTVRVLITGTAKTPQVTLDSTPKVSDADIISYLVFGRPASQLSDPEALGLESVAIAQASRLASAALMDPVAHKLGLEELAVESSAEGSDTSTSLVVGKYLRPDLRLQYVQDLEKGRGYSVNLEYILSRALRVMTTTSHYEQSGVELNWRRDY
jgi:translocation-and-assembly-module (TAM) inner membrane subunit TamB-like protein